MYYRVFQKTLKMWDSKENYPKWLFIATYFSERTRTRTFRKNGGPGLTKRRTLSQNLLYQLKFTVINSRVVISTMTIAFKNYNPKIPK